jgi:hypothetical protein
MKPNLIRGVSLGLALALFALGTPATVLADTNVVPNPGFELGACSGLPIGNSSVFCGWDAWGCSPRGSGELSAGHSPLHVDVIEAHVERAVGSSCHSGFAFGESPTSTHDDGPLQSGVEKK